MGYSPCGGKELDMTEHVHTCAVLVRQVQGHFYLHHSGKGIKCYGTGVLGQGARSPGLCPELLSDLR